MPEALKLLRQEEVPEDCREPAILSGYRPFLISPAQCIASLFYATNETFNFWTHFIPTLYFVWKLCDLSYSLDLVSDPYLWPLRNYLITICVYPLVSCFAHAFSCLSEYARHICYFVDYAAISLYSFGTGLMYLAYAFPSQFLNTTYSQVYIYVCMANALISTTMACTSRFVSSRCLQKLLRVMAFVLPYLWDTFPLVYRLTFCTQVDESHEDACHLSWSPYIRQFLAISFATFFYACHFPERLAPGRFDIVGHSHNFLHICGILATNEQLQGALLDIYSRQSFLVNKLEWVPQRGGEWPMAMVFLMVVFNIFAVLVFTACLPKSKATGPVVQNGHVCEDSHLEEKKEL